MGIIANFVGIMIGGLLGDKLHKQIDKNDFQILGICVAILSMTGFFENIYNIEEKNIVSGSLTLVILCYYAGTKIGSMLKLEDRVSNIRKKGTASKNGVLDATMFFCIGGMQICGPIALAVSGDNTQLFIKAFIDMVFAAVFAATYGRAIVLSAFPVLITQIIIAGAAYLASDFFTPALISQICALGYIILFFTGFNLLTDGKYKINNINMLPSIAIIAIINIILSFI